MQIILTVTVASVNGSTVYRVCTRIVDTVSNESRLFGPLVCYEIQVVLDIDLDFDSCTGTLLYFLWYYGLLM